MKQAETNNIRIHLSIAGMNHLPKAMRLNHLTNADLGKRVGYDGSMISKIRQGKANLRATNVKTMLAAMPEQNQFLALEIGSKLVGITAPVIDGSRILKEPLAMAIKAMPELSEALEAIQNTLDELTIPDEDLQPKDFDDPHKAVGEAYDAVLYLMNLIAWLCKKYHFEMQAEFDKRNEIWEQLGIVK